MVNHKHVSEPARNEGVSKKRICPAVIERNVYSGSIATDALVPIAMENVGSERGMSWILELESASALNHSPNSPEIVCPRAILRFRAAVHGGLLAVDDVGDLGHTSVAFFANPPELLLQR